MSAATGAQASPRRRIRARVSGTVQGVGFRPFVHRLASELELDGWVRNDERGVVIEVEGPRDVAEELLARLRAEAPPLASIEEVRAEPMPIEGTTGFEVRGSAPGTGPEATVPADAATCDACLAELLDPGDRRYRYPFVNCTDCGPRYTIVTGVPYDRERTTMAGFEMCPACRAEYDDPGDRRFHAEPNACPCCGPRVRLTDRTGETLPPDGLSGDAVARAAALLRDGAILAIKGIGGFHLACRAADERAVTALRARKGREEKPLAVMAADLAHARELADLGPAEVEALTGPARPIVLAPRSGDAPVAAAVAPRSRELGLMLPYSPLHHLLLADCGEALVMTSGNRAEEPIAHRDDEALPRLGEVADAFLLHDRPIRTRADDSVVRALDPAVRARPLLLRRSRGYAPGSLTLPLGSRRPLLGCGAELKSAVCVAKGPRAWVSHHIGDLRNWEALRAFRDAVAHLERLYAVEPALVAHDLHPDYLATRYALEREGIETVAVQHHHAHLAACLAEYGESLPAVGAIFDGSGLGPDGTVWGGEILAGDLLACERAAALLAVPLPGGDAAAREPWRMACSWLAAAHGDDAPAAPPSIAAAIDPDEWAAICAMAANRVNAPPTSSVGRLFDAVAALCGIRLRSGYEGQAAGELESAADPRERGAYPLAVRAGRSTEAVATVIDPRETVLAVEADLAGGVSPAIVSARFHNSLAAATADAVAREAERRGIDRAVLAGGVFQNRLLLERTAVALRGRGLGVFLPERLPPNDGAIAYGQVAVAAAGDQA